jgi:PKHD-type hydroxylase
MKDAFTKDECEQIIQIGNNKNKEVALIGGGKFSSDIRKNKISWLEPNEELSWIYRRMTDVITNLNNNFFQFDLYGFTEKLQFTEYNAPGDKYSQHIDKSFNSPIRKLSIVVQLTDDCMYEGCDLKLHLSSKPDIMKKNQGTLIAFPSYILHEVTPITKGTRYSLVSWIGGPNFK